MSETMSVNALELDPEEFCAEEMVHLVAVNPQQMAAAQVSLVAWLENKYRMIIEEVGEVEKARADAKAKKWGIQAFAPILARARKRENFYGKLLLAAKAGFSIIPAMPLDIFAIRVPDSKQEPKATASEGWLQQPPRPTEPTAVLPSGDGEYVSPYPSTRRWTSHEDSGQKRLLHNVRAISLKDPEFPIIAAIPEVMDATAAAMTLRIFDQIGISPARSLEIRSRAAISLPSGTADPIIVGQILLSNDRWQAQVRPVNFLIAWHLDLRTL